MVSVGRLGGKTTDLFLPWHVGAIFYFNRYTEWMKRASQMAHGKESACNTGASGDGGSISGSGRSRGGGHGDPLQYSCLENPLDRWAWHASVHRVAKSRTQLKRLSMHKLDFSAGLFGLQVFSLCLYVSALLLLLLSPSMGFSRQEYWIGLPLPSLCLCPNPLLIRTLVRLD